MSEILEKGTQIIYVPDHCGVGDPYGHPNGVQPGFVTSGPNKNGDYFCRYWQIDKNGKPGTCLRTRANSELTPARNIHRREVQDPFWVDVAIAEIEAGQGGQM